MQTEIFARHFEQENRGVKSISDPFSGLISLLLRCGKSFLYFLCELFSGQ